MFYWAAAVALALQAPPQGVDAAAAPLTLRAAIAEALGASPALGPAQDGRALAGIGERVAASSFGIDVIPSIRAGTGADGRREGGLGVDVTKRFRTGTEVRLGASRFEMTGPFGSRSASYSLGISQPLLRGWGAASATLTQARRDVVASDRALVEARQDLIVDVAAGYLDALQLQRQTGVAALALARAGRLLASSRARARVGLATELDVSRADYLVAQSEAAMLHQREALEGALDRLKDILGRPIDDVITLAGADLADPAAMLDDFLPPVAPGASSDDFIAMARARRLDLVESRDRTVDARRAETVAKWDLLPDLTVHATYVRQVAGRDPAVMFGDEGWRFGVSTGYSLLRAPAAAAAAGAAISVRAADRALAAAERRVTGEVRRAHREWERTGATIALQTKAVALAERQLRLAQIRAERGIADNFDVIDAESNLYEAQTALIQAQAARALAAMMLRRSTGALDPERYRM